MRLLTVDQACSRLQIGATYLYQLMAAGKIRSVRLGKLRRITEDAVDEFIRGLKPEETDGKRDD